MCKEVSKAPGLQKVGRLPAPVGPAFSSRSEGASADVKFKHGSGLRREQSWGRRLAESRLVMGKRGSLRGIKGPRRA